MTRAFARIVGTVDVAFGAAYLLGPARWSSSGNFAVLRQLLPVPVVAALVLLAGLLLWSPWRRGGYWLGTVALGYWGLCTAMTLPTTATGGGGPVLVLGFTALHVLGLYVRTQDQHGRTGDG